MTPVNRKRGLILNVGSFAGAIPSPMLATYSGTKAFLATFTSALAEEVRKDNIVVEHLNTYFVVREPRSVYCVDLVHSFFYVRSLNSPRSASRLPSFPHQRHTLVLCCPRSDCRVVPHSVEGLARRRLIGRMHC